MNIIIVNSSYSQNVWKRGRLTEDYPASTGILSAIVRIQ